MTPMDVVKQRMQLGFHKSAMDGLKSIVQKEGLVSKKQWFCFI